MKPKDPIWGFYDLITEGNKTISKCKACSSEVSSKVLRLKSHLDKCQKSLKVAKDPVITLSESETQKPQTPTLSTPKTAKRKQEETDDDSLHANTPKRQLQQTLDGFTVPTSANIKDKLDEQIAKFFYACNIPFNVADNPVFKDTMNLLRPGYEPPSRKSIAGPLLDKVHNKLTDMLKSKLQGKDVTNVAGWLV